MAKYNPETVAQIVRLIEVGNYAIDACLAVGVDESTYYKWLRDPAKSQFRQSIKSARAKAIAMKVGRINKAGQEGNWQADAWWLERVARARFGREEPTQQQQTNIVLGYKPESKFIQPTEHRGQPHLNAAQLHSQKVGEIMGKKAVNEGRAKKPIRPRKKS